MRNTKGCISYFTRFFSKDRTQQTFLCRQLCFSLWSHLADQNVRRVHFRTLANDAFFIQIAQSIFSYVRNISGDFFWSQFRISGFSFIFLNMDRR